MMSQKRLNEIYEKALRVQWDDNSRIVLMSDCHRGNGTTADSFINNQNILLVALDFYFRDGFTYIELGDGDELWENKTFCQISRIHKVIFELLKKFFEDGRLYMIFGNHDIVKRDYKWVEKNLKVCSCEHCLECGKLFPDITVQEAIVLEHDKTCRELFLLHGHQVDFLNYNIWKVARFLVRHFWRPLEMIGVKDPTSSSSSFSKTELIERRLCRWADYKRKILVAGHTHRVAFPNPGEIPYFNDGCLIYSRYLTALEIVDGKISMVKWRVKTKSDGSLYVGREILKEPVAIDEYYT